MKRTLFSPLTILLSLTTLRYHLHATAFSPRSFVFRSAFQQARLVRGTHANVPADHDHERTNFLFTLPSRRVFRSWRLVLAVDLTSSYDESLAKPKDGYEQSRTTWVTRGLFISSFTEGVEQNPKAQEFLKSSLISAMAAENVRKKENALQDSVMNSPCCGPNIDILNALEEADRSLSASLVGTEDPSNNADAILEQLLSESSIDGRYQGKFALRFLYIPTAMYALRPDSNNTPGKQRQRARADGKKRRDAVIKHMRHLFGDGVNVLACTLDLDDGSIKQPVGADDKSIFPMNGKEAFQTWEPHLIYVDGGNTFWLHHCLDKGNWTHDIISACTGPDAAVYCGKSAGAITAGAYVKTAAWKGWDDPSIIPGKERYEDWQETKGMSLVGNASFFPHMSEEWEELVRDKIKGEGDDFLVYCLSDYTACCVKGNEKALRIVSGVLENAPT